MKMGFTAAEDAEEVQRNYSEISKVRFQIETSPRQLCALRVCGGECFFPAT
jgi:hypothetical protein